MRKLKTAAVHTVMTMQFPKEHIDKIYNVLVQIHETVCPLDDQKLIEMDDEALCADVCNMYNMLDRETGMFKDGFRPECAA